MSDKTDMGGPKGDDFVFRADEIEVREFHVHRQGLEAPSSLTVYFFCPFCDREVKAYVWSISGGGKRCKCGAFFDRGRNASHWFERTKRTEGQS